MKYTKKLLEDKRLEVTLNIDSAEWQEALNNAYNHSKGKYSVGGFRKGHAPRKVIEKTYGDTVFYDEAIDNSFYKYYLEFLSKEKDIQPVASPEVNISKIDENGLELLLRITLKPEVKLGSYKGLTVEKGKVEVSDDEVEHKLEHLRQSRVKFVEVDREIKNGDMATIDFSGSVNGEKFDGGTATDYDLEIGSKSFIDTFEEQLIGLKKGDKKDVNVTFPQNYHVDSLKGKPAVFAVEIKAVKEKHLPELNDTFADEVSEFSTLKELKEDTKKKLEEQKSHELDSQAESKLVDLIVDNSQVDVPEIMVQNQVDDFIKDFEYRLSYQGLSLDGYLKYANTTIDDLKKSRIDDARKTVKTRLVLEQIILNEKLDVTDKDIEDKYNEHNTDKDKKKTIKEIRKSMDEQQFNYFENSILLNKLMKFLKENNKIV